MNISRIVAAFGDESFWNLPLSPEQPRPVGAFEFADQLTGFGIAEFSDRWLINARVSVDQKLFVRRPGDSVGTISVGQKRQTGAVKVYSAVVDVVWVLSFEDTARLKPNLSILNINALNLANNPFTFCDLILNFAGR